MNKIFKNNKPNNKLPRVAYFCMEYGLKSSFNIYAGGLGILAGDYLKGARDYGYPIVGIGIKWKQGYTCQLIGDDGRPVDVYHNYKYDFLVDTGVKVTVPIRERNVVCKVWKTEAFGNAPLYLLDTDVPGNEDPWITGHLYGWFGEERIAQEMVLGVGGIRALRALRIPVDVYHFNEGHAVFAGLELIREKMAQGLSFEAAWSASRRQIVFTTHTPILEGNETHYLNRLVYMGANLGLSLEQMVKIGDAPFNMTVAALRLSRIANAVSKLHCETANRMWERVEGRSEIIPITNAIHLPTWVDPEILKAAESGKNLWEIHQKNKLKLISFVKERTGVELKPDKLLIGFSRRAVPYKRSDLIFRNEKVIAPLFKQGLIQMVFSGKAHPLDDTGKEIVANLVKMARKYQGAVVFIENYDLEIAANLTQGADIWLNNPRRPKEASGTSGMKAALNGVLNFSILDGWWPEACIDGVNGWQFGDGYECDDEGRQDSHDLEALYRVLQEKIIPQYYHHREKWVEMMQASINGAKEPYSVKRMLEDYYQKMYLE
ncbi:MAG: alpha-glucan family phosphorylase [Firmicutes bacterium]|nr:alpha-glucan family phosphorylase [Bacillota bacterium]